MKRYALMGAAMAALFLAALDQTIVATSLPVIVKEFGGATLASWVMSAYLLGEVIAIPLAGKCSDLYGRKWLMLSALALFMISSVLIAQSQNIEMLIFVRGVQGLAGGAIFVITAAVVGDLFSPRERGKWQGALAGVFVLASVVGPLAGGWIADTFSWRWNFYLNIPVGITVGALFFVVLENKRSIARPSLDVKGALVLSAVLVALVLGFLWGGAKYPWFSFPIAALFSAAIFGVLLLLQVERNAEEPILPLRFFKNAIFTAIVILSFLTAAGLFGSILYIPLFVQMVLGKTAVNSGLVLLPLVLAMAFSAVITGWSLSKFGRYKIFPLLGTAVTAAGLWLFTSIGQDTSFMVLVRNMAIVGAGLGLVFPVIMVVLQNAVPFRDLGAATGLGMLARPLGGTVGLAIMGNVFAAHLSAGPAVAIGEVFFIAFLFLVAAFVVALFLKEVPLRKEHV